MGYFESHRWANCSSSCAAASSLAAVYIFFKSAATAFARRKGTMLSRYFHGEKAWPFAGSISLGCGPASLVLLAHFPLPSLDGPRAKTPLCAELPQTFPACPRSASIACRLPSVYRFITPILRHRAYHTSSSCTDGVMAAGMVQ